MRKLWTLRPVHRVFTVLCLLTATGPARVDGLSTGGLHQSTIVTGPVTTMLNDDSSVSKTDSTISHGYSLLRNDIDREPLHVWRGFSVPLLHKNLPILPKAQKGQVCRVEVEEYQPLTSMFGHLEPKKFDCSFAEGDVHYYHEGNPLTSHDHLQVTIFFFRNNNSVVQTVDIMVHVEEPPPAPPPSPRAFDAVSQDTVSDNETAGSSLPEGDQIQAGIRGIVGRVQVLGQLNVTSIKSISDSLNTNILRINYNHSHEECRLAYTSPTTTSFEAADLQTSEEEENVTEAAELRGPGGFQLFGGTMASRLGAPLASGSAVGGVRRWPLFGNLVAFNRSAVESFDHECQEALLQGYRYLHRKTNSPSVDLLPIQVTIWLRERDGSRRLQVRQGVFIKVIISSGTALKRPVARTFRQVNVTHIGGSLSILPRDSISIPHNAVPGLEYLDVNMTRMQGPLQAQIINLRDPTRPITSFRLLDLRKGLIALQLLNYAESLVKMFVITMIVVDPFLQTSVPFNLKIATFFHPVVPFGASTVGMTRMSRGRPPTFQVFSLPLFSYTGAILLVQKHNIQVVGYIDESAVVYRIKSVEDAQLSPASPTDSVLLLNGKVIYNRQFGPSDVAGMRLAYVHGGGYEPTVERIPFSISVNDYGVSKHRLYRVKRQAVEEFSQPGVSYFGRNNNRRSDTPRGRKRQRGRRRQRNPREAPSESQLELSIRIVRLYDRVRDGALQSGATFQLPALSSICLTAEDLLKPAALRALRADLVDLSFAVKVAPSQGLLLRRSALRQLKAYFQLNSPVSEHNMSPETLLAVSQAELAYARELEALTNAQVSRIRLSDLEAGDICYMNQRRDRLTDLIGLKEMGRFEFPTVYMTLEIQLPTPHRLVPRMDANVMARLSETTPYLSISSMHLNHILEWSPALDEYQYFSSELNRSMTGPSLTSPANVIYTVTQAPRFADAHCPSDLLTPSASPGLGLTTDDCTHDAGRLVSLGEVTSSSHVGDMNLQSGLQTSLKEAQAPSVGQFTQRQVDDGDIVYVPPSVDIGMLDRVVTVTYTVSCPGCSQQANKQLKILVVAEDNRAPTIKLLKPVEVARDGAVTLDSSLLSISDEDTPTERLTARFQLLPRYGKITISQSGSSNKSTQGLIEKGQSLPALLFHHGRLSYKQSGINMKNDKFIITVSDGYQTSKRLTVPVQIKPRVLIDRKWEELVNNSVLVKENSTAVLPPSIFRGLGFDDLESTPSLTSPQYFIIAFPTKGHLVFTDGKVRRKVSQFSSVDIYQGRLGYQHGPTEIGLQPMYDFAQVWDFNAGTTFIINFTLIPVNSQPPILISDVPIQVKEGGASVINHYILYASDRDTEDADIQLHVIHPPRWGHIEQRTKMNESFGGNPHFDFGSVNEFSGDSNDDRTAVASTFTMQAVKEGRVFYVNSRHADGQESVEDIFSIRAYDGVHSSPTVTEVRVAIQPTNDEPPFVHLLKYFSVGAGGRRVLTPYLFTVSDKDVPRDLLQIRFTVLPLYGSLMVYWQHGEQYVVTKTSPPITESYLGLMNLVYIQNASALPAVLPTRTDSYNNMVLADDHIEVTVSDGQYTVNRQAQILIRPANRNPPKLTLNTTSLEDGVAALTLEDAMIWTRLDKKPGGLVVEDPDSPADVLVLTILEAPKLGSIQRLPRIDHNNGVEVLDLYESAWDIEETISQADEHRLAQLALAGSIGGPKTVKMLQRGDRLTKRQMDTERIHYVYTGPHRTKRGFDECVLRLSDGDFDTAPITLRFNIRAVNTSSSITTGSSNSNSNTNISTITSTNTDNNNNGRDVTGPSLLPHASLRQPGHFEYTSLDDHLRHQQMDESMATHPEFITHETQELPVHVKHYSFLTTKSLSVEFMQRLFDLSADALKQLKFSVSQSNVRSFGDSGLRCIHVTRFNERGHRFEEVDFSYEDIEDWKVAYVADSECETLLDQIVRLPLTVIFPPSLPAQSPTKIILPLRMMKPKFYRPLLTQVSQISILPAADRVITLHDMSVEDKDTSPTHLVYTVMDRAAQGTTYLLGDIQVSRETLSRTFTQHQLATGQVVFRTSPQTIPMSLTEAMRLKQVIELTVFDAGQLSDGLSPVDDALLTTLAARANRMQRQAQGDGSPVDAYTQLLEYSLGNGTTRTSQPLQLTVGYDEQVLGRFIQARQDNFTLLVKNSPSPDSLETISPYGGVGFRLTANHLYVMDANAVYMRSIKSADSSRCYIIDLQSKENVSEFTQNQVNRRQLAILISDYSVMPEYSDGRDERKKSRGGNWTDELVEFTMMQNVGYGQPKTQSSRWTEIAFSRSNYRVCTDRGLLQIALKRYGSPEAIQANSADILIGLVSGSALEGQDFSLSSKKLVTFERGEEGRTVAIRLHPILPMTGGRKKFYVDIKSPTGAILGANRRAVVTIRHSRRCRNRFYFTPQTHHDAPVKRDVAYTEASSLLSTQSLGSGTGVNRGVDKMVADEARSVPVAREWSPSPAIHSKSTQSSPKISLTDWLAVNSLPDSKTLSASYERSIQSEEETNRCIKDWTLYDNHCYRLYTGGKSDVSWSGARERCETDLAFLASVTSESQAVWLAQNLVGNTVSYYWIGMHMPGRHSPWTWHNLERVGFTNWAPGFPTGIKWKRFQARLKTRLENQLLWRHTRATGAASWPSSMGRIYDTYVPQPTRVYGMPHWSAMMRKDSQSPVVRTRSRVGGGDQVGGRGTGIYIDEGPRACVLVNGEGQWENQPCKKKLTVGYICMMNPEI